MITITLLSDGYVRKKGFLAEHGLSIYIDNNYEKILFDTGQQGIFKKNAKKLSINLNKIDYLLISHGHYDHIGGINNFFKENTKAKLIFSEKIFEKKYKINEKDNKINYEFIGIKTLKKHKIKNEIIYVNNNFFMNNRLFIINKLETKAISDKFKIKIKNKYLKDNMDDEISLCIIEDKEITIITGCAHSGIINIINQVKNIFPDKSLKAIIGGFHLEKINSNEKVNIINYFNNLDFKYLIPMHCTGIEMVEEFKNKFNDKVIFMSVGETISI